MRHPSVSGVAWLLVLLGLTSCGGSDGGTGLEEPRATSITVSPNTVSLSFIGGTANLTATIKDQNGATFAGTVTWSSDDPSVSSVSSGGVVTAVSNGTGTVRAVFGSLAATATVPTNHNIGRARSPTNPGSSTRWRTIRGEEN